MAETMLLLGGPWDGKVLPWSKGEPPKVLSTARPPRGPDLTEVVSQDDYARTDERNGAGQWLYKWLATADSTSAHRCTYPAPMETRNQ